MTGTFTNWARILERTLRAQGYDLPAAVAAQGGVSQPVPDNAERLPVAHTRELWAVADRLAGDPALGLSMVDHIALADFQELGMVVVTGGSLSQVLGRVGRYYSLLSDTLHIELTGDAEELVLVMTSRSEPHWRALEFGLALIVRMLRTLFGNEVSPLSVELPFRNPDAQAAYEAFFHCPVYQQRDAAVLVYDLRQEPHSPSNSPALIQRFEKMLDEQVAALNQPATWTEKVSRLIAQRLNEGEPSLADIAGSLHTSARSLQRHLSDECKKFQDVLDDTRRKLAQEALKQRNMSLTELAFVLGFSSSSAFSRAYKRWFGEAPGQTVKAVKG